MQHTLIVHFYSVRLNPPHLPDTGLFFLWAPHIYPEQTKRKTSTRLVRDSASSVTL